MRVPRRGCDGEMRRRRKNSAVREQEESGGEGGRRGLVVVAGGSKGQRAPTMAKGCSLYLPFFPSPFYISLSVFLSPLRPCSFFLFPFPFCFTSLTWFVLHATFRGTPEVLCSCVSKYPFEGVVSSYRRAADLIFFFFFVCSLSLSLSVFFLVVFTLIPLSFICLPRSVLLYPELSSSLFASWKFDSLGGRGFPPGNVS